MNRPSLLARLKRMNERSLFGQRRLQPDARITVPGEDDRLPPAEQTRAEAVQRLQVGLFGIGSMVLLVGLASIIGGQADLAEETAVPEAAPTTEPTPGPAQANPLADAGVVPDIAAEPVPAPEAAAPRPAAPAANAPPAR